MRYIPTTGPVFENSAIVSLTVVAPTVHTLGSLAGDASLASPNSLPADTATNMPLETTALTWKFHQ